MIHQPGWTAVPGPPATSALSDDVEPPPRWRRRAQQLAVRWFRGRARHVADREVQALEGAPRFRPHLPLGRSRHPYGGGEQTFRALVQINLLPRAR